MDGLEKAAFAAKSPDQLHGRAEFTERGNAQHVGIIEIEHALIGIFIVPALVLNLRL
jgi:hypothetical protein